MAEPLARRPLLLALRLAWLAGSGLVIAGLAAEVALQADRRAAEREAQEASRRNVFDVAALTEVRADALWRVPNESYRPGARLDLEVAGERYSIVINSHGFRDREVSLRKPPGVYRVACVGGSTTVQGRTNAETWPALLQERLGTLPDGRRVEVLNLGVNGTGSGFWLESPRRLERLYAFQPDLVVEYSFVNDLFWRSCPATRGTTPGARRSAAACCSAGCGRCRRATSTPTSAGSWAGCGRWARPPRPTARPTWPARSPARPAAGWPRLSPLPGRQHRALGPAAAAALLPRLSPAAGSLPVPLRRAGRARRRLATARLPPLLEDPALYVDLCHMTPRGIAALAEAFAPAVLRLATQGQAAR